MFIVFKLAVCHTEPKYTCASLALTRRIICSAALHANCLFLFGGWYKNTLFINQAWCHVVNVVKKKKLNLIINTNCMTFDLIPFHSSLFSCLNLKFTTLSTALSLKLSFLFYLHIH